MNQKTILIILIAVIGMSCHQSRLPKEPNDVISIKQPVNDQYSLLNGNWRLTGYSAYMSPEDMDKIPDFATIKVIYNFNLDSNKLMVTRDQKKTEHDYSLSQGEGRFWANQCMIKIGSDLYMYQIKENELRLDSNYDPSIGPDGIVYSFVRVD